MKNPIVIVVGRDEEYKVDNEEKKKMNNILNWW